MSDPVEYLQVMSDFARSPGCVGLSPRDADAIDAVLAKLEQAERERDEAKREREQIRLQYESACRGVSRNGDKAAEFYQRAEKAEARAERLKQERDTVAQQERALRQAIIEMELQDHTPEFEDDPNGPGQYICPLCYATVPARWEKGQPGPATDLVHKPTCPIVIARTALAGDQPTKEPVICDRHDEHFDTDYHGCRKCENEEAEREDKAIRFDLDRAGIEQREREAVELVELRAALAAEKARADAADRQAESYRKDWLAAIAERDRAEARADRLEAALRGLVEWGRGMVFYPDAHGPLMDAVVALGEERAQQELGNVRAGDIANAIDAVLAEREQLRAEVERLTRERDTLMVAQEVAADRVDEQARRAEQAERERDETWEEARKLIAAAEGSEAQAEAKLAEARAVLRDFSRHVPHIRQCSLASGPGSCSEDCPACKLEAARAALAEIVVLEGSPATEVVRIARAALSEEER